MAKAAKAWRPLVLPEQHRQLNAMSDEYQTALDRLSATLERERGGADGQ